MKKLNTNSLFNIFSLEENPYHISSIEEDSSFILLGTVVKGVESYFLIDRLCSNRYGESYISISSSLKLEYFDKLFKYLRRVGELQSDTVLELEKEFTLQGIKYALEEMLEFYTEIEHYEKCILIHKFYKLFLGDSR
jgi:hypothetical protein